jgi:hypothetical protein
MKGAVRVLKINCPSDLMEVFRSLSWSSRTPLTVVVRDRKMTVRPARSDLARPVKGEYDRDTEIQIIENHMYDRD